MYVQKFALTVIAAVLLAACGGGGGQPSVVSTDTDHISENSASVFPETTTPESSINDVPVQYRTAVQANKTYSFSQYEPDEPIVNILVNNQNVNVNKRIDLFKLPNGLNEFAFDATTNEGEYRGRMYIYNLPYSMVVSHRFDSGTEQEKDLRHFVRAVEGLHTTEEQGRALLAEKPIGTVFEYKGDAFNGTGEIGRVAYQVTFQGGSASGSGDISGLTEPGTVNLNRGFVDIDENGHLFVVGTAQSENRPELSGGYGLYFFGPKADEIAGTAGFDDSGNNPMNEIGFAAKLNKEIAP